MEDRADLVEELKKAQRLTEEMKSEVRVNPSLTIAGHTGILNLEKDRDYKLTSMILSKFIAKVTGLIEYIDKKLETL